MASWVTYIAQKRTALCKQLITLQKSISGGEFDLVEARLRLDRVRTLLHAYEELNDELALLEIDSDGVRQMDNISNTFYTVAAKIESANKADRSVTNVIAPDAPMGNSTFIEHQRQLKLPVAELPKFNGNLDEWLSFKNTFKVMVDSRADITDLVKFMYLKNCLKDEAANKISEYDVSTASYQNA